MKIGDVVILRTPENKFLNEAIGHIKELTHYGAVIATANAATGQFRALINEFELVSTHKSNGRQATQMGYTGDVCDVCGGSRMTRSGSCLKCEDCGTTSGCG